MESRGELIVAPSKTEADGQLLQFAEYEKDSHVISNDQYRDYGNLHPWVKTGNRVHGFNLVPLGKGVYRVLVAGFNLDIVVEVKTKASIEKAAQPPPPSSAKSIRGKEIRGRATRELVNTKTMR